MATEQAISVQPTAPAPAAAAVTWLDLELAARLCGQSERHLRRLCGARWRAEGKARLLQEPGQKSKWQIRTDADPLFSIENRKSKVENPPVPAIVAPLSKPLAQDAGLKLAILDRWDRFAAAAGLAADAATDRFVDLLTEEEVKRTANPAATGPSRGTLYRWRRLAKSGQLNDLVDGRKLRAQSREQGKNADPFLAYLKERWQRQARQKFAVCYDRACDKAAECGWDRVAESVARRFIKALDQREDVLRREGPQAYLDKVKPFLERDYSTLRSNEIWDSDHHQFDVLVQVGERSDPRTGEIKPILKRPWLTAWQDLRSRKITGHVIRAADPNTDAILAALDLATESHGAPEIAYTDNGKDYDARIFTGLTKMQRRSLFREVKVHVENDPQVLGGIYAALGIRHIHAWPYHGQSKPIERFFGTVGERFSKEWDAYCGRSPDEKPEQLLEIIARGKYPTLAEFTAAFADWLEGDYHQRIHTGDSMDMRPALAWEANLVEKRVLDDGLRETMLRPRYGPLKVSQNGVTWSGLHYGRRDLSAWWGQEVYIRVRRDLSSVSVWDAQDNLLAVARPNEKIPANASPELLRRVIGELKHDHKVIRQSFEAQLRRHESTPERLHRLVAADTKALQAPSSSDRPPVHFIPVRPDLEGQLNALQFLEETAQLRLAAGAESLSTQTLESAEAAYGGDV